MDGTAQRIGRAQPAAWQVTIGALLGYGLTYWLNRILPIPTGLLHSAIAIAPFIGTSAAASLYYRGRIGPWQGWVAPLYCAFHLFRPPLHTAWYTASDIVGIWLLFWVLMTQSTWRKTT